MEHKPTFRGLLCLTILMGSAAAHAQSAIEEAGIRNGALVAGPVGGKIVPLAAGGKGRDMPVISPDGTRIAFAQVTDKKVALSDVVVVSLDGRELARAHIEPVIGGVGYAGMRYVEELRWISPSQLVVGGSINPSTSQYYTIDAVTGAMVDDFTDDSSHPAFSPDGHHVAVLADSPHFASSSELSPVLLLDGKPIWTPAKGTVLAAPPQFSKDGSVLAWAARDAAGRTTLNIRGDGDLHRLPLPVSAESDLRVFWSGPRVVATASPVGVTGKTRAWSADADGTNPMQRLPVDPEAGARALRRSLVMDAESAGIRDADFWCAACSLADLPRRSGQ